MLKKIIYLVAALAATSLLSVVAALLWLVVINPGDKIGRENIHRILAMESPVYYRDGERRVGVFFEQAHRQYVHFSQIPEDFIHAIVAAEDSSFFNHHGIDFTGVGRAALANIKARRVVQGGSTITQQTAKNLFERRDRSLAAKLRELLYALRLEYHYDKEEILEFYINQFFVSGNGRGLGMAARYFFDKPVEELSLLESAFIAGSVKGPNRYNPFIKRSEEEEGLARQRARQRTGYVLEQMRRLNYLDDEQLAVERAREIPFNQGRMAYALNTILDLVRDGLAEPEVVEALSSHGIDNVATSGIRIITSVDWELQQEAVFALRKELSRLDTRLQGYDHRDMQEVYAELSRGGDWRQPPGAFLVGSIVAVEGTPRNPLVRVDLSGPRASATQAPPPAYIDRQGLFNLLQPLARYRQHAWSEAGAEDLARLLEELKDDDLVYVSVRERNSEGELLLDLEKYPELQGGVLAMQDGAIRAMVGGVDNRHFNRAVTARRPMGSAMKPLVYAAALQLGWNSADRLDNRRNIFVYQQQAYFPRPFQEISNETVSLSWAGVTSENLASIWLLYHLLDHLPPARFAEVTEKTGLAREPYESQAEYTRRIRDHHGVVVDRAALHRAAYERAVELMEPDLLFADRAEEYELLRQLPYGSGFERFADEVREEFLGPDSSAAERREGRTRLAILERNLLRYLELRDELRALVAAGQKEPDTARSDGLYRTENGEFVYGVEEPPPGWQPVSGGELGELRSEEGPAARFWDRVLVAGLVRVETLDLLEQTMEAEYRRLAALPPYGPQVLSQVRDFRVLAALHYLVGLSRALGVESQLEPVLSFPLGANAISLLELARIFDAFQDGRLPFHGGNGSHGIREGGGENDGGLAIIKRIENSEGKVIYEPRRVARRIFSPEVALGVSDILYNAMEYGTGRSARNRLRLAATDSDQQEMLSQLDLRVPLFGKTGTANRYLNAAFAGYLASPGGADGFALGGGHTVAVYVGFDDNRPMVRGTTRITGGAGALPVWSRLAEAVYRHGDYADVLDLDDLAFAGLESVPLRYPALAQVEIPVDDNRGGVVINSLERNRPEQEDRLRPAGGARIVTFGQYGRDGSFEPERFFVPYWNSEQ